jgi:hypothetical protein
MVRYMWEHIESMQEVRIPSLVLFALLVAYWAAGGYLMQNYESEWPFSTSFYFAFISCMKIGFGDVMPSSAGGVYVTLVYWYVCTGPTRTHKR